MLKSDNELVKFPMHPPQTGSDCTPCWLPSSTSESRPCSPEKAVSLNKLSRVAHTLAGFSAIAVTFNCRYKSFTSKSLPEGLLGSFLIKAVNLCQDDIKTCQSKGKRHKCLK